MGGGTDTDEAFLWQIKNANGGDFVICVRQVMMHITHG